MVLLASLTSLCPDGKHEGKRGVYVAHVNEGLSNCSWCGVSNCSWCGVMCDGRRVEATDAQTARYEQVKTNPSSQGTECRVSFVQINSRRAEEADGFFFEFPSGFRDSRRPTRIFFSSRRDSRTVRVRFQRKRKRKWFLFPIPLEISYRKGWPQR